MNLYSHLAILLLFKCIIVEATLDSPPKTTESQGEVDNHTEGLVHDDQPLSSLPTTKEDDQNHSRDDDHVDEIEIEPLNDRQNHQNNPSDEDPEATEVGTGDDSSPGSSMEFDDEEIKRNQTQQEFLQEGQQDDQLSDENIDENNRSVRLQYIALLDENPIDIKAQSKLPFVIQSSPENLSTYPVATKRSKTYCYSTCTLLHSKSMYEANSKKLLEEGTVEKYTDFVFAGFKSEGILPIPTCPMESSEQTIQPDSYKFVNHASEEILTTNILKPVVTKKKIDSEFWPSTQHCKHSPQLSFTKIKTKQGHDQYNVGYVVKFDTPPKYCSDNTKILTDNMIFFQVASFGVNRNTRDTIYSHHSILYYDLIRKIKKVKGMYTQYIKNEHIPRLNANFDLIYSERNQQRIFEQLFPGAHETYFNPTKDLVLVKQELMDQKMLPLMTFKQAALSYINIVPMYKIIRDHTWSKVEEAVSRIPLVKMVTILSGVLNQLKIEGKPVYLDDATETQAARKTITVPKIFYKFVVAHVIHHQTNNFHNFGIVILTHNDPFEENPEVVCPSDDWLPCEKFGSMNVEQKEPALGFTYCCKYSRIMAKVLGIEEGQMRVSDDFDIDELKKVVGEQPEPDKKKSKTDKPAFYKRKFDSLTQGRPSSPGKPTLKFDPDNSDPDIVTIKWDPPLFDGGSKITGYLVEHRRTGSPHWVKASPIKVRQTQLTISGLEPGWRYQFRVTAENAIGYSDPSPLSEPLAIFVHRSAAIAPYFITELDDVTVLENEKVEFKVTFEGVPFPKIAWYKDGLEIFSNRCQKIITEGNVSAFLIYEAAITDESEIKCSATNRVGYAVTKAYLKVEAPPTIRLPRQYDEGLIFEEGEIIRLKVSVVGQPQPFINWYFNGERITASNRYDMEYADKAAVLKIKDAQRDDRGEYQIQAINELGEDVASIMVTIANKPQPPGKIAISGVLGRSVTLTWPKPYDDGGCKIGSYIIEYYKAGWNVWLKAATCRQLTTTLDDLIEGSQYKFRVKAENPYGVSEPSPETDVIFIPDLKRGLFEAPKTAHSTDSFVSEFRDHFPPVVQNLHHSAEFLDGEKLQAPVKPKRKYKARKLPQQQTTQNRSVHLEARDDGRMDYNVDLGRQQLTPSPQPSSNIDDMSRTSSELMLVLVPGNEDVPRNKGSLNFDNISSRHFSGSSIPPPMSLSAPELGCSMTLFKPLQRNCVSSTEILHESTIARFYEDMVKEDALKSLQEKLKIPPLTNKLLDQAQMKIKEELKPHVVADLTKIEDLTDPSDIESVDYNQLDSKPEPSAQRISPARRSPSQSRDTVQRILNERCQNQKEKLAITIPDMIKPTTEFAQGRYSPTSGTFHYPDLFMESLNKSPQFKPTANSMYEVVNEIIHRKSVDATQYPVIGTPRSSVPEIKLTDENNLDYNIPHGDKLFPSTSSVNDDRPFSETQYPYDSRSEASSSSINDYDRVAEDDEQQDYEHDQNQWDCDDTESDDTEDDSDDYEDGDQEDQTYHPDTVLSFERALEISNPTRYRSVSPTTDKFLESDTHKLGLHYYNKYVDNDDSDSYTGHETRSKSSAEKLPKSILKCHRFSEHEDTTIPPSVHSALPKSPLQKKQVRIEEPTRFETMKLADEHDLPDVAIVNHYSDIVKQYGYVQKPPTKVYLTYDELKAAAQMTDDDVFAPKNNHRENTPISSDHQIDDRQLDGTRQENPASSEVEKVKNKVHFMFDFFLDIVMFAFACWLYCFKDERLAIPVIVLMIYRQVYDKIKSKIPSFNFWKKKNS